MSNPRTYPSEPVRLPTSHWPEPEPQPVPGCDECAKQARRREAARGGVRQADDPSAIADANIRIARHPHKDTP